MESDFSPDENRAQGQRAKELRELLNELGGDLKKASEVLGISMNELVEITQKLEKPECSGVRDLGMQLEDLCQYEVNRSNRYGRCVSVVMVESGNGPVNVQVVIGRALRTSDAVFPTENGLALVMAETASPGLRMAVERFKSLYNGEIDLRYGAATYPGDAQDAEALASKARTRLVTAKSSTSGALVYEG